MGQNLKGLAELEIWPTLLQHWMQLHGWMSATAPEQDDPSLPDFMLTLDQAITFRYLRLYNDPEVVAGTHAG